MDPDANLLTQRQLVDEAQIAIREGDGERALSVLDSLSDLVGALDEWIVSGGFLPADWQTS